MKPMVEYNSRLVAAVKHSKGKVVTMPKPIIKPLVDRSLLNMFDVVLVGMKNQYSKAAGSNSVDSIIKPGKDSTWLFL